MDNKYIGMDVHKETISIAVMNGDGKLLMESIIETKASTILQFIQGLHGDLHVTFEEGTWAAWLYDVLRPRVPNLIVCDPRKNALRKEGNKSDKIDARKLADLLRGGYLRSVYHGEHGLRTHSFNGLGKPLITSAIRITSNSHAATLPPPIAARGNLWMALSSPAMGCGKVVLRSCFAGPEKHHACYQR
jgi:Transposase